MRYFTDDVLTLGFVDQYDASLYFTGNFREVTGEELDRFLNPENYLSDEEKLKLMRSRMPVLSPIQFDIKLRKHGLLQTVREFVATNEVLDIAYNRATFFKRDDPLIETARTTLGLSNEQVDEIWMS